MRVETRHGHREREYAERWRRIVKLSRIGLIDPQHARLATGLEPIILGVGQPSLSQLDCEHHSAACRGRSVTLVGAGGWWPDPQLD